jgi:hypothetical protein
MWSCVDPGLTDVKEERIASIFRVEKSASREPASAGGCRMNPVGNNQLYKNREGRFSETSVNPRCTQRHIPEDDILHSHHYENLEPYIIIKFDEEYKL